MSSSKWCFLAGIQVSQEAGKVAWYSHLFKNFPKFVVIHRVKGFSIVSEEDVDVLLEFPCFSMIQWMLAIWSLVPLPFLNQLEHLEVLSSHTVEDYLGGFWDYFASMWNECNCAVVWLFFDRALQIGIKTDLFQSCSRCWVFQFPDILSAAL